MEEEGENGVGTGKDTMAGGQLSGPPGEKAGKMHTALRLTQQAAGPGSKPDHTAGDAVTALVGGSPGRARAAPMPGASTQVYANLARELDIYLLVGLSELRDGQVYNAIAVLDRAGTLRGVMRKVHINKFETGGGWRNGSEFPVWDFQTDTGTMR